VDTLMADLDEEIGYFGPESILWRVAREAALVLGGGRAVLMQLAHPLVAAGVGAYSSYATNPWARFQATVDLTQALVFGTRSEVHAAARTINHLHVRVRGSLAEDVGPFAAGTAYRAHDPALLLWVLATLIDSALLVYPLVVGPLSEADQEGYYQEERSGAILLGLPAQAVPPTLAEFREYMREMLAGDQLVVTEEARRVAHAVMHFNVPPIYWPILRPARAVMWQTTVGFLPERLRADYGYTWSATQDRWLRRELAALRRVVPHLPPRLRYLPPARAAYRRVATRQRALVPVSTR
jgi:uncharacterized protein (DUF2236 family)